MTRNNPPPQHKKSKHGLFWPILTIMGVSVAAIIILVFTAFDTLDKSTRANLMQRVEVSLEVESERMQVLLAEYTYWDEAYQNLIIQPDAEWADLNIGSYMTENLGMDLTLAVTGAGKPTFTFIDGKPGNLPLKKLLDAGLQKLLDESRKGSGTKPSPVSGYIKIGRNNYSVAVDQFVPEQDGNDPYDGSYLVVAKRMDQPLLEEIAQLYRLPPIRFLTNFLLEDKQHLALTDPFGQTIAVIGWPNPTPAGNMLAGKLPILILLLLIMAALTRWVLYTEAERRKSYENMLHNLATTDSLTDIYNRREFLRLAEGELARSRRYGDPLAMVMLDVDNFKQINDTQGHHAGDQVLVQLANCISRNLRDIDIFGRLGGEEFAILLPMTDHTQALETAERLRKSLTGTQISADDQAMQVTASFGVAGLDDDGTLGQILRRADTALYEAKRQGRNCCMSANGLE